MDLINEVHIIIRYHNYIINAKLIALNTVTYRSMKWRTIIVPEEVYNELMMKARSKGIPTWKVIAELLGLESSIKPASQADELEAIKQRLALLESQLSELRAQLQSPSHHITHHNPEEQSSIPEFAKNNPWIGVIAKREE